MALNNTGGRPMLKARKVDTPKGPLRVPTVRSASKKSSWVTPSFDDFGDQFDVSSTCHLNKGKSSQKILVGNTTSKSTSKRRGRPLIEGDLWVDRHAPLAKGDLAVHKKKVVEVEEWLKYGVDSHKPHGAPVLLLTGPAGSGKTATIHVLAKELGCEVMEWTNSMSSTESRFGASKFDDDYMFRKSDVRTESQETMFRDFLLRANKYPSLVQVDPQAHQAEKKIILLEEFPNAFYRDAQTFHHILRRYRMTGRFPLIAIISDSPSGNSNERLLFPKALQTELDIHHISINPVAPTTMTKTMSKIAISECHKNKELLRMPGKEELESIAAAAAGDIRGAINALQFACLKSNTGIDVRWTKSNLPRKAGSKKERSGQAPRSSQKEAKSSSTFGSRDTSLILFRALGKVLYCKRREPGAEDSYEDLPEHLQHHYRDPLLENPEEVIEKAHMSGDSFTAFLHQNYLDFFSSVEDVVEASAYMSDADALTVDWASRPVLQEYSTCIATRGLLFCNSTRARAGKAVSSGWKPLHKPEWFSVFKKARTNRLNTDEIFRGYRSTAIELITELIPYMYLNNTRLHDPEQISLVQEMGKFHKSTSRGLPERLTEQDFPAGTEPADSLDSFPTSRTTATAEEDSLSSSQGQVQNTTLEEQEEMIIQDFDD